MLIRVRSTPSTISSAIYFFQKRLNKHAGEREKWTPDKWTQLELVLCKAVAEVITVNISDVDSYCEVVVTNTYIFKK